MNRLVPGSAKEKRTILYSVLLVCVVVAVDQLTKFAVIRNIPEHSTVCIIPNFFNLTYINNPGAAWGIFSGYSWALLAVSVIAFAGIIIFLRNLTEGWAERYYFLALILGGIVGNAIDRVCRKEVVDFLDFYIRGRHWPAFNVADSAICVGVALFIFSSLIWHTEKKESKDEESVTAAAAEKDETE